MKHLRFAAAFFSACIVLLLCIPGFVPSGFSESAPSNYVEPKANELEKVLILEYHLIQTQPSVWSRSPNDFRNDLEILYKADFRSIALNEYIQGKINLPAGTHAVIFTFDDSSPGQFRYLVSNGKREIDPDCAVGIFIDFKKRHPDFGMNATFFVLPGAKQPHKLFGQPEFEADKLKELVALGFEIGNHTLWHANLGKYNANVVEKQLGQSVQWIQKILPGYDIDSLALPFGVYPKNPGWAVRGSYLDTRFHNRAILRVSGGPADSPFSSRNDLMRLPRIQVTGNSLQRLIAYFEKHQDELFTSDGNANKVTFPSALKPEFDSSKFRNLQAVSY